MIVQDKFILKTFKNNCLMLLDSDKKIVGQIKANVNLKYKYFV